MLARPRRNLWIPLLVVALGAAGCGGGGHKKTSTPTPTTPSGATATATHTAPTGASATPTSTGAVASATASPTPTHTQDPSCPVGPVTTSVGEVCGTTTTIGTTTVRAFLGIPYGEDTGGANRWQAPIPMTPVSGKIQATHFGPICPQPPTFPDLPAQSEDCLSINVWSPAGTAPGADLPVMVFIYGGSFLDGTSAVPAYDGAYLSATQNVVLVTFNYRLGALGFLAGVEGLSGNYGIRDQQLALQWVTDNIAAFGGDGSNVLLFGESAGAMSVGLHLLSIPSSEGLFTTALMESNPLALPYKTLAQSTEFGSCLQMMLGCESGGLACMRGKSAADIVAVQEDKQIVLEGLLTGLSGFLVWAPAIDGTLITQQPLAASAAGLPRTTLLGTNLNEGTLFVYSALQKLGFSTLPANLYQELLTVLFGATDAARIEQAYPPVMMGDNAPVLSQAVNDYLFFCATRHLAAAGVSPVFAYEFTQVSNFNIWPQVPQCADQVCHGNEIPYVFHTATNIGETFTPAEEALSQTMADYWGGFSRSGSDPNNGGATRPIWPAFPGFNYLILGTPITTAVDPPHNCSLWDSIGYETLNFSDLATTQSTCVPPATPTPTP